jgi:hypothetical protein
MKLETKIYTVISLKPHTTNEIIHRLLYSNKTIYNALEKMIKEKELLKQKTKDGFLLTIPNDYHHEKKRELLITSLAHGIDPNYFLKESSQQIFTALDHVSTIQEISEKTGYSKKTVQTILQQLYKNHVLYFEKKKPIVVKKNLNHPLGKIYDSYLTRPKETKTLYHTGSSPYQEIISTPENIEKILYDKIDEGISVKNTDFLVISDEKKISRVESVPRKLSIEETFLHVLFTPEGVEDLCLKLLASGDLDFQRLLQEAIKKTMVNSVGCYLNIVHDVKPNLVPEKILHQFHDHVGENTVVFLKEEQPYGKTGWEKPYEKQWNVDLYLDRGALQHGLRSV